MCEIVRIFFCSSYCLLNKNERRRTYCIFCVSVCLVAFLGCCSFCCWFPCSNAVMCGFQRKQTSIETRKPAGKQQKRRKATRKTNKAKKNNTQTHNGVALRFQFRYSAMLALIETPAEADSNGAAYSQGFPVHVLWAGYSKFHCSDRAAISQRLHKVLPSQLPKPEGLRAITWRRCELWTRVLQTYPRSSYVPGH